MMTTSTRVEDAGIAGLLERVEKATGPDREIDAALASLAGEAPVAWTLIRQDDPRTFKMDAGKWISPEGHRIRTPKPYTSSIDAALALVERMLPGWCWKVVGEPEAVFRHCAVLRNSGKLSDVAPACVASHRTPALAIIAAMLSVLSSLSQGAGHEQ